MSGEVQDVTDLHFPDLTWNVPRQLCLSKSDPAPRMPYVCTRPKRHGGRHSAADGIEIVAVWVDQR